MMSYSAVGSPQTVAEYLEQFAEHAGADELIVALASPTTEERLRTLDLVAAAVGVATV
jgi:alkanesulfonate monooxygenase SsuD/methylene tetrahydromethanopterin reductase-like flavin-dependent oxidoreductase (luciferase family)